MKLGGRPQLADGAARLMRLPGWTQNAKRMTTLNEWFTPWRRSR